MVALFDVNAIIALIDANHIFHEKIHAWWDKNHRQGWASCPLVENGVIRVMSQAAYSAQIRLNAVSVADLLQQFRVNTRHEFWPDSLSILDGDIDLSLVTGHRQITDLYLLALAAGHRARLVTFDGGIARSAVPGAGAEHLVTL